MTKKHPGRYYPAPIGARFGRLTVIGDVNVRNGTKGHFEWLCKCDCGNEIQTLKRKVKNGKHVSCGCYHREAATRRAIKHGRSGDPIYVIWASMHQRCYNPKSTSFHNYGGRGITVCERWHNFEAFAADMGERPSPAHSIDRKDGDKGYSPDNCRWATTRQQIHNQSRAIAAQARKLNFIAGGTMSETAKTKDQIYAIDCKIRREKDPTAKMQLCLLMAMLKNDDLPKYNLDRQLAVMGAAIKPRIRRPAIGVPA